MTTDKQIAANQENAKKSTGPRTSDGKRRSRRNALRHGLTAETVIGVLENAADYEALAAAINADYRPATNFELQLIGRLVSVLWRLRRATAIESGLLALQTPSPRPNKIGWSKNMDVFYRMLDPQTTTSHSEFESKQINENKPASQGLHPVRSSVPSCDLARSFVKLANEQNAAFDRLWRYETALWRQALEIVLLLNSINRSSDLNGNDVSANYARVRASRRISGHFLWPPFKTSRP